MWKDVIEQYKNLLITEYRNKTKARSTIGVFTDCSVCDGLPLMLRDTYVLDHASGAQLTVLGKIVGVPRDIIGLDLVHNFFSFTRYYLSPASVGFGSYGSQPDANLFLRYNENAVYTLSDFELKTIIKLRIILNTRFATHKSIKDGLWNYFHGDIDIVGSIDTQNIWFQFTRYSGTPASLGFGSYGTVTYNDGNYFYRYRQSNIMEIDYVVKTIYQSAFESALYLDVVPRAMGVGINTQYV
jgi:hypothetical protein